MAELAEHVLLSRSGMTRLIDRLEREGMVCRSTCDKDGRGCYAGLTDPGARPSTQARPTHIAVVRARLPQHFSETTRCASSPDDVRARTRSKT